MWIYINLFFKDPSLLLVTVLPLIRLTNILDLILMLLTFSAPILFTRLKKFDHVCTIQSNFQNKNSSKALQWFLMDLSLNKLVVLAKLALLRIHL